MKPQFILAVLALALALSACGQPSASSSTPPAPTTLQPTAVQPIQPTVAPAPAPSPTPALAPTAAAEAPSPAATSAPATVLPAPLLFIDGEGQLRLLEADGLTTDTLSDEPYPVFDFAVAPDGDTIAFLTIANGVDTTLVRIAANGSARRELARGVMRGVTVAADGSVQVGVLGPTVAVDSTGLDSDALGAGTWSFPTDDGASRLLAAATEPATTAGETTPGVHSQPLAWSPDGGRLLLRLTMNLGPDGPAGDIGSTGLGLYDVASGQARDLLALGAEPLCVVPAWGRAGDSVLCANGGAIGPPTPPLWRLSLVGKAPQTHVPAGEPVDQVFSPRELSDGISYLAGESAASPPRLMPRRLRADGTVDALLPQPVEAGYDGGLWAPDGSGMIIGRPAAGANRTIVWQPLNGSAPVELLNGSIGKLEWGRQPSP